AGGAVAAENFNIYNDDGSLLATATTKKIESPTMLTDIFPTILDYVMGADYMMPTDRIIDGHSLKTLLSCNEGNDLLIHDDALYYMKKGKVQAVQARILVNGEYHDFKYYENVLTENSAFIDQHYKNYLFDLDADPAEGYNVSMIYPEIADELHKMLKDFRKELNNNRRGIL
ncbi:MAG: hypothetical protein MJ193_04445, partial [Clostridia bacterium]|nr:hypothetical protein [Clostridia bacterium]